MVVDTCTHDESQLWIFKNGTLATYGGTMCLDVTDGVNSNGVFIQVWECTPGNVNQQWELVIDDDNINFLRWKDHGRCLRPTYGDVIRSVNVVLLWDCSQCVETFNVCLITDSRNPVLLMQARFRLSFLCCERLTLGVLLEWWITAD